jgi:hypothetical protein
VITDECPRELKGIINGEQNEIRGGRDWRGETRRMKIYGKKKIRL